MVKASKFSFAFGCCVLSSAAVAAPLDIAILGDSLSTGAATHPALTFDSKDLWNVFTGATSVDSGLPEPMRLWPAPREFFGSSDFVFRNALQSLSRRYLDTEEYSWGYKIAQKLGVAPAALAIAGEDGARTLTIPRHIDRVLEVTDGVLPRKIFLFYSGNDLCGPTLSYVTTLEDYEQAWRTGLDYMARNGKTPNGGSDIYVVGFLSVLQLLHEREILDKKIKAFGEELTCADLREQAYRPKDPHYDPGIPPEAWYFSLMMPPNPVGFCPTLFGGFGAKQDEMIGALANRIRGFRESQRRVVEGANARFLQSGVALRVHFVPDTTELIFKAEDIAGDCFHLSLHGQERVADAVFAYMSRSAPKP